TSSLKPYVLNVILEKIIIDLEDEVVNLLEIEKANLETIESLKSKSFELSENAISESENQNENNFHVDEKECDKVENSKINFEDDYFQEIINPDFEKIDSSFQQTSSPKPYVPNVILEKIIIDLEDEVINLLKKEKVNLETIESLKSKEYDKEENPKVIALGMFKLNVSQCVSPILMSCDSNNVEIKLKRKRHLDTFSSVRRPKNRGVIWKKKGSSNTSNVGLSVIVHICLWIIDSGYSKHMTGPRSRLSKVYIVRNEDGVDLLTVDRSSNLYTISLNEVASNSLTCLLAKASSLQSWLWHQRLSHSNFATINNLVKNNLVQSLPKMKFKKDHLCSTCEQGKTHRKHRKSKTAFASNKPFYLLHMDLCGPMRVQSINEKRYVLVVVDDYSRYTWVFFLHSKDEASEVIISFIKKTQVNLQLQV
nr:ribonuclease H-like domain-containing protein [Tanacetum cinerariifolium]